MRETVVGRKFIKLVPFIWAEQYAFDTTFSWGGDLGLFESLESFFHSWMDSIFELESFLQETNLDRWARREEGGKYLTMLVRRYLASNPRPLSYTIIPQ